MGKVSGLEDQGSERSDEALEKGRSRGAMMVLGDAVLLSIDFKIYTD